MEQSGQFDTIELHPMGENGIWRDVFVGFKEAPSSPRVFDDFPAVGATQTSNASGYWSDNWVGQELDVCFRADTDISKVRLYGWCPDECSGASMTLRVSDQKSKEVKVKSGKFKIDLHCSLRKGDLFGFHASVDRSFRAEGDNRDLSVILRELKFR